jgi:hypothetical protein
MAELWLPMRAMVRPVNSERDELLNKLIELRVRVPGAEELEISELRDLVQWQTERRAVDIKKALWRPANRPKKYRRQDVLTALRDYYHNYVIPRRENRKHIYLGAGTGESSDG